MPAPFDLPYAQRGLIEVLLIAPAAGLLGTWIVLRGLAFFAHATGTAAFPGLVVADGLSLASPVGALGAAALFALGVGVLRDRGRTGEDSVTAVALVGALAAGVLLASDVFRSGSGIEQLLFGSLLLVAPSDLALAASASVLAIAATIVLGPRWLAEGFDASAARDLGVRSPLPRLLLLGLIAFSVTVSLAAVGALLVTALFVVPAATARLGLRRLVAWQVATVALAAVEGVGGLWLSLETDAPPGAAIAVVSGGLFALAALARLAGGRRAGLVLAATLAVVLAGCGSGSGSGDAGGRLRVVATTTQVADFARAVGGRDALVVGILRPNSDPHDYEPRPSDVRATAAARVILTSGQGIDRWMGKVTDESGADATRVDLSATLPDRVRGETTGPEASRFDPHWWHDPHNAEAAVREIRDALAAAAPAKAAAFRANARRYLARLARLDAGIARCMDAVPATQRRLVTDHDAFGYFARRYGVRVIGAAIPSQTTQAQASADDVARLARTVRAQHVRAIFPESSLNPKVVRALARETGARADLALFGDTLGPAGSDGATYLTMERANADAMVRGFTDGARRCRIAGIG